MFKTKRSSVGGPPSTPKINSVALPTDGGTGYVSWPHTIPKPSIKPKTFLQSVLPFRSMTPVPARTRRESLTSSQSSRTRTSSLSSLSSQAPLKTVLKPSKTEPLKWSPVTETSENPKAFIAESTAVQFSSPYPTYMNHAPHGRCVQSTPPLSKHKRPSSRRSRESSSDGSQYVLVTEAPLKAEAISLTWPLVPLENRRRNQFPPLYFDVAFDPRLELNIRVRRRGDRIWTPLTRLEEEMPVSSHCRIPRMVIDCKELSAWPIIIERREGVRCMDVFCAIYETFQKPLTAQEIRAIGQSYIDICKPCFKQRCKDSPGIPEYNEKQGMLRVDLLRNRRIFKGIEQSGPRWVLTLEKPMS